MDKKILITEIPLFELPDKHALPPLSADEENRLDAEVMRFINIDEGGID